MTRYEVSWAPTSAAEQLAKSRGCNLDHDSLWDFVEEDEITVSAHFDTFLFAVSEAKARLVEDLCGQVRVARQALVRSRCAADRWQYTAVWFVTEITDAPIEDEPEHEPEFELLNDETIVE